MQVTVGGSENASTACLCATNTLKLFVLQYAEQLDLQLGGQLADFVQEQGASSSSNLPFFCAVAPVKRLSHAQTARLANRSGVSATVDSNEGMLSAWAPLMNSPRYHLLARATFA